MSTQSETDYGQGGETSMAFDCIEDRLKRILYHHGNVVGKRPLLFIILPVLFSLLLALGGLCFRFNNDVEYLFTPINGPAKRHREQVQMYFPMNYDNHFLPNRQNDVGRYVSVYVTTETWDGNILTAEILDEILKLHKNIITVKTTCDDKVYSYGELCAKWNSKCVPPNPIFDIYNYQAKHIMNFTYPLLVSEANTKHFIGGSLGGVQFYDNTSIVKSATAITLYYPLKPSPKDIDLASGKLEEAFFEMAIKYKPAKISFTFTMSQALANDLDEMTVRMIPRMVLSFAVLTVFSVLSLMMMDWVTSKPILGCLGVVSALLAIVSTVGLLSLCGVPFIHLNIAMPFLTLGIGVDDMFIMVASWRTTSRHNSVADRMAETFSEAALSITITSITDVLAFGIGAISTFPSVQIFCCYCGVAILFDYLFQITFFAGCMALIGRREHSNRHCLTYRKVVPRRETSSVCYRLFCAGGVSKKLDKDKKVHEHIMVTFFDKYYGPFITLPWMKFFTLIFFLGYLAGAVWGCMQIHEGLQPRQLALEDSYSSYYYNMEERHFNEYGPIVQVVVDSKQRYSNKQTQNEIEQVLTKYENDKYFYNHITQSWLRDYIVFIDQNGLNYTNEETFIFHLKSNFLTHPLYKHYVSDITFENSTIVSSRFLVVSHFVNEVTELQGFLHRCRDIAGNSSISMFAYHPTFVFNDHFDAILPTVIQNVLVAAVGMMAVSLILIPRPICSLYITVTIASIVVGVMGYMSLWGVGLDFVSMHAFYIIAIVAMSTANSYVFRAVFKTLFFGIFWGGVHGLLFLPVLLSVIGPKGSRKPVTNGKMYDYDISNRQMLRFWATQEKYVVDLQVSTV
uniref:Patched domain-containing protein 3-like n=1 Tax=Saccoglossus kowalevskii TaxID=10224 RepID=A0ABM0LWI9_SACKO|nr:PREDICTED: patched domain-containing protein 3-like [Saccoglossus kowalevskii]